MNYHVTRPAPRSESPGPSVDRARFREFVDTKLLPHAADFDSAQRIPEHVLNWLAEVGAWGALAPTRVGGLGLDMLMFACLHEEVGRGCSSVRSLLTVHSMVTWSVEKWGDKENHAQWLTELAQGKVIASFCLTEPGAGSDAAAITTTAAKSKHGWVLNGHKKWITGGQAAGLFLVFAKTERGMSAFLVPRQCSGLNLAPVTGLLGTRASMVADLYLDDCLVEADALIGPDGFGLQTVLTGALDIGRLSVACGCVGILQACLDASVDYSAQRVQRGQVLSDHQLVRRMITDMATNTVAARLMCERAATCKGRGDPDAITATLMAKYFASTAAMRAASDAVQIHGAVGCGPHSDVGRHFRDAKVMEIIEGSSEIQQLFIAEAAYRGRG